MRGPSLRAARRGRSRSRRSSGGLETGLEVVGGERVAAEIPAGGHSGLGEESAGAGRGSGAFVEELGLVVFERSGHVAGYDYLIDGLAAQVEGGEISYVDERGGGDQPEDDEAEPAEYRSHGVSVPEDPTPLRSRYAGLGLASLYRALPVLRLVG